MKRIVALLLLLACSPLLAEDGIRIETTSGIHILRPSDPSQLKGEAALRSGERTARLAAQAVIADAKATQRDLQAYNGDVAKYEQANKDAAAQADAFNAKNDAYNDRVRNFQGRANQYQADAEGLASRINTYNARPNDQRDQATANQLNAEAAAMEARRQRLSAEKDVLDADLARLNQDRAKTQDAIDGVNAQHDDLERRAADINARQGRAYRQLKQCNDYAEQIKKLLSDQKSSVEPGAAPTWDEVAERIKGLAAEGFDR